MSNKTSATTFDRQSPLKDAVIRYLKVWPKWCWGNEFGPSELSIFGGNLRHRVVGLYGLSIGRIFLGTVRIGNKPI
jgi:hypothetical protein